MADTSSSISSNCKNNLSHRRPQIRQLLLDEAQYDCDAAPPTSHKRSVYLSWDDYFMSVAMLSAHRSKDPRNPRGACIVDEDLRVVGIGYNGFPRNCSDDLLPWTNHHDNCNSHYDDDDDNNKATASIDVPYLHTSSPYECHAEINAILNKCSADVAGATLYVAHYPNNDCAKMIAQSRIRKVVYMHDLQPGDDAYRASRIILGLSGVETLQYQPSVDHVTLELLPTNETACATAAVDATAADTAEGTRGGAESTQGVPDKNQVEDAIHRAILKREANWIPPTASQKRKDYLSWDDYFMAMAFLTAKRSKDPNTQVGACIVSPGNRILAMGYNGFPRGCCDDALPWARSSATTGGAGGGQILHTKYPYVCHAETNCILNKCSSDVRGATLYVALFPCNECAKIIIQAGIVEVVYLQDTYHDTDGCRASRILFGMAGVKLRRHVPAVSKIRLELK